MSRESELRAQRERQATAVKPVPTPKSAATVPCPACGGTGRIRDETAYGATVRAAREGAGLSLRAIASAAECSAPYVSDLELGKRSWDSPAAKRVLKQLGLL